SHRLFTFGQTAFDASVHLVAVKGGGMGKVGLEEDVIHANFINQTTWRGLLKPITSIDVARKVFRRQHLKLRVLFRHAVTLELVVERFEDKRNPPDAAFY